MLTGNAMNHVRVELVLLQLKLPLCAVSSLILLFFSYPEIVPCSFPCLTCDTTQCLTCEADYYLYQGACLDSCPEKTYYKDLTCEGNAFLFIFLYNDG